VISFLSSVFFSLIPSKYVLNQIDQQAGLDSLLEIEFVYTTTFPLSFVTIDGILCVFGTSTFFG
jgi:hypothetical protein